MKAKTTILTLSLSVILSLGVVSLMDMPQVMADDDEHDDDKSFKKLKKLLKNIQHKKPHFETDLTSEDTVPLVENEFSGKAKAWLVLDDGELKLKYWLKSDMDLNPGWPGTSDPLDDITKIHLHNNEPGESGMHVLNVYKAPAQDDDDVVVKPNKGVVKGLWDNGDENLLLGDPTIRDGPDSVKLSSMLGELCAGNIYANVHGTTASGGSDSGSLRGNFDPTNKGDKICDELDKLGLLEEAEHGGHEPHT